MEAADIQDHRTKVATLAGLLSLTRMEDIEDSM